MKQISVGSWLIARRKPGVYRAQRNNRTVHFTVSGDAVKQTTKEGLPSGTFIKAFQDDIGRDIARAVKGEWPND